LKTLDEYFADTECSIDYLKIDTQGTELLILKGAAGLLRNKKISLLKAEVSTIAVYKNQVMFSEIDFYLRSFGYTMVDFITYGHKRISTFNNKEGKRYSGHCGDAIYAFDIETVDKGQELKKALMLSWSGYTGLAINIQQKLKLEAREIDAIVSLSHRTFRQQLRTMVKNLIPLLLFQLLKKIKPE